MRSADALRISGKRQKREDRRDPDHLKESLRKRQRKNRAQFHSPVRAGEEQNAPNQISNVVNKWGQGGSELRVEEKSAHHILQRRYGKLSTGTTPVSKIRRLSRSNCFHTSDFHVQELAKKSTAAPEPHLENLRRIRRKMWGPTSRTARR